MNSEPCLALVLESTFTIHPLQGTLDMPKMSHPLRRKLALVLRAYRIAETAMTEAVEGGVYKPSLERAELLAVRSGVKRYLSVLELLAGDIKLKAVPQLDEISKHANDHPESPVGAERFVLALDYARSVLREILDGFEEGNAPVGDETQAVVGELDIATASLTAWVDSCISRPWSYVEALQEDWKNDAPSWLLDGQP